MTLCHWMPRQAPGGDLMATLGGRAENIPSRACSEDGVWTSVLLVGGRRLPSLWALLKYKIQLSEF